MENPKRPKARCRRRLGIVLALIVVLQAATEPCRSEDAAKRRSARRSGASASTPGQRSADRRSEKSVRLRFFNASWRTVLEKVAKDSGSTLIMRAQPPGRISRLTDPSRRSRSDAVRILNRELEPLGFTVLEQGDFLIVIDLHDLRTKYRRSSIATAAGPNPRTGTESRSSKQAGPVDQRRARPTGAKASSEDVDPDPPTGFRSTSIRAAAADRERDNQVDPVVASRTNASDRDAEVGSVAMRNGSVKEIAGAVFRAFGARADLIQRGPGGLPGFSVSAPESSKAGNGYPNRSDRATDKHEPRELFSVGIDVDRNKLVVSAPPKQADALQRLLRKLDALHAEPSREVQLVSTEMESGPVADEIERTVKGLLSYRQQSEALARSDDETPRGEGQPESNDAASQQGKKAGEAPAAASDDTVEGLRNDVSIESVDDLGVLILRGDKKDVEAVKKLIREIEELGLEEAPGVRLLRLEQVNSEALAPMLEEVYKQLVQARTDGNEDRPTVRFLPVVRPNAVLIIAPEADMLEILELAEQLDQPLDPSETFQVFRLKSAAAVATAQILNDYSADPQGLGVRLRAVAEPRTNSVIVQASPRDLREVEKLIREIDRDDSGAVTRMRIFPLRSAFADELAAVIDGAIRSVSTSDAQSGAGRNRPTSPARPSGANPGGPPGSPTTSQNSNTARTGGAKSVVIEFLTRDGDARSLVRSGLLDDVHVTADLRTNSLIVTAPEQSMRMMEALIAQLDQPTSAVADIKIFALENSDATSMVRMLDGLFSTSTEQEPMGVQVAGAEEVSSSLRPPDLR